MDYKKSEHIRVSNLNEGMEKVYNVLVDYSFDVGLSGKELLRFRLLTEEVVRLIKSILQHSSVELWFEGTKRVSYIVLKTESKVDNIQKEQLGSITSEDKVTDEKGFFGKIVEIFNIMDKEEQTWSLREYQDELRARKQDDKYSMEAWEDLERSLVANLADDIEITFEKSHVEMVVTKDFTKSLSHIGSGVPEAVSEQIIVSVGKSADSALEKAEDAISELELDTKNALHARLVFEETIGMLKELTGDYDAVMWFEKYKNSFCLKLTAKTEMDYDKKNELLDMATDRSNRSVKGVMDKIGDVIQNSILNYERVARLSQTYTGGYVNYGTLGMYGSTETMLDCGIMWSLEDYRNSLSGMIENESESYAQEAWDELEKSIVANLANDVLVGVKGNRVDMTIVCNLK